MTDSSDNRPRFDTLFLDPHHYRADLRLARTAIRRRWVRPEDRPALVARMEAATRERGDDPDHRECVRRTLGEIWVWLEMDRDNLRMERRERTGGKVGRPRLRPWVSDFNGENLLDAHEVRRDLLARGVDIGGGLVLTVKTMGEKGEHEHRIIVAALTTSRYGVRLMLLCPGCGRYRMRLYPRAVGLVCRVCGRVGYKQHRHDLPQNP